ncbi:MAG: ATP synthase F1 subunit delta [Oscillospiraceae bacterium]
MAELVSQTYANALFETAMESNLQDEIKTQINDLCEIISNNSDYVKILSSPIVGIKEKHELVNATFNGRISDYLLNLIFVLVDNNRFAIFFDVTSAYNKLHDRKHNILRVTAVTATELSASMKDKLQNKLCELSKKDVVLLNEVDETLIGGVLLKYDNMEIDGSVKTKLDEIKKQVRAKTL